MARQGLAGATAATVDGAARAAAALQAQDLGASRLAVRARTHGLHVADVDRATDEPPAVVRTWLMRGTLHLVAAEDVRWLVALFGPGNARRQRRRRLSLGLDDELCRRAADTLPGVLAGGPMTRAEIVRALGLDLHGQAPAHLVAYAAAYGVICRGPERGTEPTYVLLDTWAPPAPAVDEPEAELARRYFAAYAPASADDFVAWSGLPAARARRAVHAVAAELTAVTVEGQPAWLSPGDPAPAGTWRLLGAFDAYLLGYRDRRLALDPRFAARINSGGGWVHPAVVRDGRVVGTWQRRAGTIAVELFEPGGLPGRGPSGALEAEARDIGRFLGMETRLRVC